MAAPTTREISKRANELWAEGGNQGRLIAQPLAVFREYTNRAHVELDPSFIPGVRTSDMRPETFSVEQPLADVLKTSQEPIV